MPYAAAWPRRSGFAPCICLAAESPPIPRRAGPGISNPEDVLTDIRRITDAASAPLLVDADTGWGGASTSRAPCGAYQGRRGRTAYRGSGCRAKPAVTAGKEIVPQEEMVDRIKAAVDARDDEIR